LTIVAAGWIFLGRPSGKKIKGRNPAKSLLAKGRTSLMAGNLNKN